MIPGLVLVELRAQAGTKRSDQFHDGLKAIVLPEVGEGRLARNTDKILFASLTISVAEDRFDHGQLARRTVRTEENRMAVHDMPKDHMLMVARGVKFPILGGSEATAVEIKPIVEIRRRPFPTDTNPADIRDMKGNVSSRHFVRVPIGDVNPELTPLLSVDTLEGIIIVQQVTYALRYGLGLAQRSVFANPSGDGRRKIFAQRWEGGSRSIGGKMQDLKRTRQSEGQDGEGNQKPRAFRVA